jgi:hypothetical protein
MSYIVVSSFENVESGDLQRQGESVAVFTTEALARAHFLQRSDALDATARVAATADVSAAMIAWVAVIEMPLDIDDVEQALEDLETVVEDAEEDGVEDPFEGLTIAYAGTSFEGGRETPYPRGEALRGLQAWLS